MYSRCGRGAQMRNYNLIFMNEKREKTEWQGTNERWSNVYISEVGQQTTDVLAYSPHFEVFE